MLPLFQIIPATLGDKREGMGGRCGKGLRLPVKDYMHHDEA